VGGMDGFGGGGTRSTWKLDREAALALPNVRHIGPVAQNEVRKHYWRFAINWMPYDVDHAFNQASCPTKIMDSLASGRPLLSTDVPECRLYPEWISIFRSADEAVTYIRSGLNATWNAETAEASRRQTDFVLGHHTWEKRAQLLTSWLPDTNSAGS
jgi:teichuronic acid biosynthesis glycosyltransferase TuaH